MATLSEIEKLAKEFSETRELLKDRVTLLEHNIAEAKKKMLPGIRRAVEAAAEKHIALFDAIAESQGLFVRPKTVIFHGIKLGYQKGKGEIAWEDEAQVIRLIKKNFPEEVETLIKIKETVLKNALAQKSAADLKKIGVTVVETGDEVFIKPTDSEIDKLINALLKDEELNEAA
jgi:hypothetical protein